MRKLHYLRILIGLTASFFLAAPSFGADESGWFFGISLTRPQPKLELPSISFAGGEANSYKFLVGYQFGPHWKAELNYLDIDQSSYSVDPVTIFPDVRGKGFQVVGTASMPVTKRMGVFGKLGAFYSNLDSSCAASILTCASGDRGADLTYGLGLRYDFTKTVSVLGEWERFQRFSSSDTIGETYRDFFSVGVGFKF